MISKPDPLLKLAPFNRTLILLNSVFSFPTVKETLVFFLELLVTSSACRPQIKDRSDPKTPYESYFVHDVFDIRVIRKWGLGHRSTSSLKVWYPLTILSKSNRYWQKQITKMLVATLRKCEIVVKMVRAIFIGNQWHWHDQINKLTICNFNIYSYQVVHIS